MQNYWRLSDFYLFSVAYAYVDHNSYLADQVFIQDKITVKYTGEMVDENSSYCIVLCKVRKKDAVRFEASLGKLKNKMLLMGYRDYPDACDKIAKILEEGEKEMEKEKKEKAG